MSLLKYRVSWEDDDSSLREIEILSSQTFFDFHTIIKQAFQLPEAMEASIFVADGNYRKERELSSTVEKNLKDAPALSMKKTPVGALISDPYQRFVYECVHDKGWVFLIETITMTAEPKSADVYPRCVRTEGISPSQLGVVPTNNKDSVMEIEEKYDLNSTDGFGDEGEDDLDSGNLFGDDMGEEAFTEE